MERRTRALGTTHPGRVRESNEDAYTIDEEHGVHVVCDGLGGHAAGEVASRMAVDAVAAYLTANAGLLDEARGSDGGRFAVQVLMDEAINDASRRLFDAACRDEALAGMATTITAAVVWSGMLVVGHVGDCRLYLQRRGRLERLTTDHTLAEARRSRGVPDDEIGSEHVLTRAVAAQPSVLVETLCIDLVPGDRYLLCTDGLHRYFEHAELAELLRTAEFDALVPTLVERACERGGEDNLTAVVIDVAESDQVDEPAVRNARRLEALAGVPPFQALALPMLTRLLEVMTAQRLSPGESVVRAGDPLAGLYVLVDGRLEAGDGDPGRMFGTRALVREVPADASVVAASDVELLLLPRQAFARLVARYPRLGTAILWSLLEADEAPR